MLMGWTVFAMMSYAVVISAWMYQRLHREGGLGEEEIRKVAEAKRAAESTKSHS